MDGIDVPLSAEGYRMIIATSVDVMRERLRYWPDLESADGPSRLISIFSLIS